MPKGITSRSITTHPPAAVPSRTRVFVSYSHEDGDWLTRFLQHVAVLERKGLIDVWSDARIPVGAPWEEEIESALTAAKVAVLLVSPAFLASEFIWNNEMPRIMTHSTQGMDVLPLIVRPCAWRLEEDLARLQARPADGRPLSLGSESQVDLDLCAFTYELAARVGRSPAAIDLSEAASTPLPTAEEVAVIPAGDWQGYYNRTRPLRLVIREVDGDGFHGRMEYPEEGTVTFVKGSIHEQWSPDDPIWAQVGGTNREGPGIAVGFRETDYERKGGSSISFDGEYRAFVNGDQMIGAWFSGNRLVGSLTLRRVERVVTGVHP